MRRLPADETAPIHRLDQIAQLCRRFPADRKLIFAPSRQVGVNVQTAIARRGVAWANLETTTVAEHAEAEIGARFRAEGWSPLTADSAVLLLLDVVQNSRAGFFRKAGLSPALIRGLLRTLTTLRTENVSTVHLGANLFKQDERSSALEEVFRAFHAGMGAARLYDKAILLRRALKELGPDSNTRMAAILDETQVSHLECTYLEQRWPGRLVRIDGLPPEIDPPEDSAARRLVSVPVWSSMEVPEGGIDSESQRTSVPGRSKDVGTRTALGSENEVAYVLRRVLSDGLQLDRVEVAYSSESPYLSLLIDMCDRFGIEAAYAEGIPAMLTGPGQALHGFLSWIRSGYEAEVLTEQMRSGSTSLRGLAGSGDASDRTYASLIDEARVGKGLDRYVTAVARLAERKRKRASRQLHRDSDAAVPAVLSHIDALQTGISALLQMVPAGERCRPSELAAYSMTFLESCCVVRSERDRKALESIRDRLAEVREPSDGTIGVNWMVRLLLDMIERHKIEASTERAGRLYVVPLSRAAYSSRERLYIVGLDQDSFRASTTEDPFLLDVERTAISKHLVPMYRRSGDSLFQLQRAIEMAVAQVELTASVYETMSGDTLHVAPVFQEYVADGSRGKRKPITLAPEGEDAFSRLDATDLLLGYRKHTGYAEYISSSNPAMTRGRRAQEAREQPGITHFDGWISTLPSDERISENGPVLSASRLERLAACPYRYFLRDILRVKPPAREDRDPTRWLNPMEFGVLLHEVYCDFLTELYETGEQVDAERHAALIEKHLDRSLQAYRDEVPVFNEAAKRADMKRLLRSLKIFLNAESRSDTAVPIGFEISFGQGRSRGRNLAQAVPLRLGSGTGVLLSGKIDRVERDDQGYVVIDYKTGSQFKFESGDLLNGGLNLQWALYALALEKLIESWGEEGQVVRSGYYFASFRGNGRRIEERPPSAEELGRRIAPLVDIVGHGFFPHVQKEKGQCRFCDYRMVCRDEAIAGSKVYELLDTLAEDPRPFVGPLKNWIRQK